MRLVLPIPSHRRLRHTCPLPLLRRRRPRHRCCCQAATIGARYLSPLVISAHTTRAVLLASATITSMDGLRASMPASHELGGTPLRLAQRTTPLAPMISSRRSVCSPMRDVRLSRVLPPVDFCTGIRPTYAAKSRPSGMFPPEALKPGSRWRSWGRHPVSTSAVGRLSSDGINQIVKSRV